MHRVLVIDDIPAFLADIKKSLKPHFRVSVCANPRQGIARALRDAPELLITTLVMQEMGGLDLIRALRSRGYAGKIVMITRFGDLSTAQEATRLGASDYLTQPYLPGELIARLRRVLAQNDPALKSQPLDSLEDGIITADPKMMALLELAHIAADADSRILILGETGTGKELLARAIHRFSRRVKEPFMVVNCAAIQENLLESELFGHEKGAFTGAVEQRQGRFEQAGKGTLFLDEIGEISLSLQAKLLRVLQGGDFSRVGSNAILRSEARVVAATNQDLRLKVKEGSFRSDLFFRLNVVTLTLPSLRERAGDLSLLADFFFRRFTQTTTGPQRFSDSAMEALQNYSWPGNIRELEHLIERSCILIRKPVVDLADLPSHIRHEPRSRVTPASSNRSYAEARRQFEINYFREVLDDADGNYAAAARMAAMERTSFYRKARSILG